MFKAVYKCSGPFTLKRYDDSNLCCQTYVYPTTYAVRSAILSQIIQLEGLERAEELFRNVKNASIFIVYPKQFKVNGIRLKRYSNSYYGSMDEADELNREKLIASNFKTTIGFREYADLPQIVFYIDNSIPDIEFWLKNIDCLGTAESLVYLDSLTEVDRMENVLVRWDGREDVMTADNYDWEPKIEFDNIYMYSSRYSHKHTHTRCMITDICLGTGVECNGF